MVVMVTSVLVRKFLAKVCHLSHFFSSLIPFPCPTEYAG